MPRLCVSGAPLQALMACRLPARSLRFGTQIQRASIRTSIPQDDRASSTCAARSVPVPTASMKHSPRCRHPMAAPPMGATQALLNQLNRHGQRPAHVHIFVTSDKFRKLTTQFNIEGDPLIWDDFAFATREGLIPPVVEKDDGRAVGFEEDAYRDIEFDLHLTERVDGKDNQIVERARAAA